MKKVMFATACIILSVACESKSGHRLKKIDSTAAHIPADTLHLLACRAKVLENNTITYALLNPIEQGVLRASDTVWLNLETHCIDDTSNNTMKAVIYPM